jgi:glutathione S-transferase
MSPEPAVLYCHPDSGFSYKVALALSLLGIDFEQRHVDLSKPRGRRSQEFRELASFGEVPVLLIDGHAICQSNAILDYLARREGRLDGSDQAQRLRVREWLSWEANRISLNLAHARFGRLFERYADDVIAWYDRRSRADLDRMQDALAAAPFVAGAVPTIADVACCGYLYWADQAAIDIDGWPAVRDWLERIAALPGWRSPEAMFSGHRLRY